MTSRTQMLLAQGVWHALFFAAGVGMMSLYTGHRINSMNAALATNDKINYEVLSNEMNACRTTQAQLDAAKDSIAEITKQRDDSRAFADIFVKQFSERTILEDASANLPAGDSARVPDGLVGQLTVGAIQGYEALHAKAGPRWIIPARIEPTILGAPHKYRCEYQNVDGTMSTDPCTVHLVKDLPR